MTDLPHGAPRLLWGGAAPAEARLGLVLLHGRGGRAEDILRLGQELPHRDIAYLAPEADGNTWWPCSFLAPEQQLAPWRAGALSAVELAIAHLAAAGLPRARIGLAGFSQGACLALEYAARRRDALHSVHAFSGGLLGTGEASGAPQADLYGHTPKRMEYDAAQNGLPVFLGCHDTDPHIPLRRVEDSAAVFKRLGADVHYEAYPGAHHMVMPTGFKHLETCLNPS